eukprot:307415-Alexandrium_andersonii.AAC.1
MCIRDSPDVEEEPAPPAEKGGAPRCLRLFSGPGLRKGGLSAIRRFAGWDVDDVDIVNLSLIHI